MVSLTGAYRTTSTLALPVIAGVLPIDLEILERAAISRFRRGEPVDFHSLSVEPGVYRVGEFVRRIRVESLRVWQARWDAGGTGRLTHCFFPSVEERMKNAGFLRFDFHATQLVGGHGEFRAKLFDFGLADDPWCACGYGHQTAEHVIWTCPILTAARDVMLDEVGRCVGRLPIWYPDLVSCRCCFQAFRGFVKCWVSSWEDMRLRGSPSLGSPLSLVA